MIQKCLRKRREERYQSARDLLEDLESLRRNVTCSPSEPIALPREEFALPRGPARALMLVIQCGYLAMYCSALYFAEIPEQALERVLLVPAGLTLPLVMVSAMCGIAVRLYLLSAVGLDHPATGVKFRWLFPGLLVLDALWAASPLLRARKIGVGVALACVAGLAYLPFSQRTLVQSAYRGSGPGISPRLS